MPGVYLPGESKGPNPKEVTLAERLKERGYLSLCIGKWHLGEQPEFLPTHQGLPNYFGIPYSNNMQMKSTESGKSVIPPMRDNKVAELLTVDQQSLLTGRYTDEALRFITEKSPQTAGSATGSKRWTGARARCSTPCANPNWCKTHSSYPSSAPLNLDAEIGEKTDVAASHPEIVAQLTALAEQMNAGIGGPKPSTRRPAGVVNDPKTLYPADTFRFRKKG